MWPFVTHIILTSTSVTRPVLTMTFVAERSSVRCFFSGGRWDWNGRPPFLCITRNNTFQCLPERRFKCNIDDAVHRGI